jgi:dolichol-phosphate mannosyltransferase
VANLWVVMPAYNEEACVGPVVSAWMEAIRRETEDFTLCVLNDGSTDRTLERLRELAANYPQLVIVDKPNSGHGQSCLMGYRLALEASARWILQIDSDGQCDPAFFGRFWSLSHDHPFVFGFRKKRLDGTIRSLISRAVSLTVYLAFGVWVRDANVPYRLMRTEELARVLPGEGVRIHLANVYLSALIQRSYPIRWVPIHFLNRIGGTPSVKAFAFLGQGVRLFRELRQFR